MPSTHHDVAVMRLNALTRQDDVAVPLKRFFYDDTA